MTGRRANLPFPEDHSPVPGGFRERKKRETRHALSVAAIRPVVERGYNPVRVEDIADQAGREGLR
jgi:hypothetical protein